MLANTSHPRRLRRLTGSVVPDPDLRFRWATRPSGSPQPNSPSATMQQRLKALWFGFPSSPLLVRSGDAADRRGQSPLSS